MKRAFCILAVLMLFCGVHAEGKKYLNTGSAALTFSVWKPSALDDAPSEPLHNVPGGKTAFGLGLTTPSYRGNALQLSFWQWQHQSDATTRLRIASLDVKTQLITQYPVCPFVLYGAALLHSKKSATTQSGYAFNFGAGVEIQLCKHGGLAFEYQYIYADLHKTAGMASDYSGPRLTAKLLFLF
jgi:hypothetical protein